MRRILELTIRIAVLVVLSLGAASCVTGLPVQRTDPLAPSTSPKQEFTELEVQSLVMGMADEYSAALGETENRCEAACPPNSPLSPITSSKSLTAFYNCSGPTREYRCVMASALKI